MISTTTRIPTAEELQAGQLCETCENGCSCQGGIDPECGHFGCWGIPSDAERCPAYEVNRRETYAALGLPCPEVESAR